MSRRGSSGLGRTKAFGVGFPDGNAHVYCYVFATSLASSSHRWTYNYDGTNVGVVGGETCPIGLIDFLDG